MDIFKIHQGIVGDYADYIKSFVNIKDEEIRNKVVANLEGNEYWPDPLIQFNPSFEKAISVDKLIDENIFLPEMKYIFKDYELYKHQEIAIRIGAEGKGFIVTSGTGSGKSLTYMSTIFNYFLKNQGIKGIKAIIVYPMNALINSQYEEIEKYAKNYKKNNNNKDFPIKFKKYTGQESENERDAVKNDLPDIILTNYMMLELIMTRTGEKSIRDSMCGNLEYLVFDELHTYRGRQGADVALLIRRIKALIINKNVKCIGTSATMASGETIEDEKKAIAEFAEKIFNQKFEIAQIINEKLEHTTNCKELPSKELLKKTIENEIQIKTEEDFKSNPLAIWLENKIALRNDRGELERGQPQTRKEIIDLLVEDSSETRNNCEIEFENLLSACENLSINAKKNNRRESFLPFKIHQFISQTGTVYVTLAEKGKREIKLQPGYSIKDKNSNDDILIYPVLFSRVSGKEFICVRKDSGKLIPGESSDLPEKISRDDVKGDTKTGKPKQILTVDDFPDGYIVLPDKDEVFWGDEFLDFLPVSWKRVKKTGIEVDNFYEFRLPQQIWFNEKGEFSHEPNKYPNKAWFIAAPLIIDPSCGIIYDTNTIENSKLMRIGNEGRSSATTMISYNIIKALNLPDLVSKNQKLLSFTDNRQDASLQSGHFNDFIHVSRIRSAVYNAILQSESKEINIFNIADEIFKLLNLNEEEYARHPAPDSRIPSKENQEALKDLLLYRIIFDLKRGWRFNLPNLEQCALLSIKYNDIDTLAANNEIWKDIEIFGNKRKAERENFLTQTLNYFRTSYAISSNKLEGAKRNELQERLKEKLNDNSVWALDKNEEIDMPKHLVVDSIERKHIDFETESIGKQSSYGKYIKHLFKINGFKDFKVEMVEQFILKILSILNKNNFICERKLKGKKGEVLGYQLLLDKVLWTLGDEKNPTTDEVRTISYTGFKATKPNAFFQNHYKTDFTKYAKAIVGKEHTGQISSKQRKEREASFKEADIQVLFCSPTMELGIDIAELSMVHMRNVPPSPANYAQRSGRAGRSGQAAIVFTYCSSVSPHDSHYFKYAVDMVAGKVTAPNIELRNEELINSHLNALILTHINVPELKNSIGDVIETSDKPNLPIKSKIIDNINRNLKTSENQILSAFDSVLNNIIDNLRETNWYSDSWTKDKIRKFTTELDNSFKRWRELYKNAENQIIKSRQIRDDSIHKKNSSEMRIVRSDERHAENTRYQLLNRSDEPFSEFYPFRYLASAGFLPGYNFTKLPVRVLIKGDETEFISRNKFVGIKEFGPQNLIYHNGNKYRVVQMQLDSSELHLQKIIIAESSGYIYLGKSGDTVNNDPINGKPLKNECVKVHANMLQLTDCHTNKVERISCEEEERTKSGYDIKQYFYIEQGIESAKKIYLKSGNDELLRMYFARSAKIVKVNYKWKRSKGNEGFLIAQNGFWKKAADLENEKPDNPISNVHIFTDFTSDVLYIQPMETLKVDKVQIVSLQYALRKAIEQVFKIEPNEIEVVEMGNGQVSNILIYENTEGSIGILSQMAENANLLRQVFVQIYEVCHFDKETKIDLRPDLAKATYDDLLSYYNQMYHSTLDRHSIIKTVNTILSCEFDNSVSGSAAEEIKELKSKINSKSEGERIFLEYIEKHGIALPDYTNYNLEEYCIQPDFVYKPKTVIFVDGGVHKINSVKAKDLKKRKLLKDNGYDVIVWEYDAESIEHFMERRKDIFRKIR